MQPSEPPLSGPDVGSALLREQVPPRLELTGCLESRYRTLLSDRSQMFWSASPDGAFRESPAWCEFTGQSPETAQGPEATEAIHPEDRPRAERAWRSAQDTKQGFEIEYRLRRHDGVYRWFVTRGCPVLDERGEVQEWIGWSRDIEQEKRATEVLNERAARIEAEVVKRSQALSKSEAMLAESQRLAKIGSFELDIATGQLTWSAQQFRNFGLEPTPELRRDVVVRRIHPDDAKRHEAVVKGAIERGEAFAMDYRVVHPDARVLHIHTIGQPVFDAEGRLVKLVGTSQDVTERALLEARLRTQYEQLMKLDTLKNDFVNSVTHELRTPLTSIMGYAEFLEDQIDGPVTPGQQEFISQIQRGARRLEYLLNDLLDFARIEAGTFTLKMTPAELGERVREALESLRPQADETRLALVASLPDSPLVLEMDAQRIGQVLTNLISNAIKFSPKGGTIVVSTSRRGEHVRCEVEDAGPGIAPEDRPRLFQRFSQLEAGVKMGKGAGLGLSISKALVEAHGGTIGVESILGAGSTFWFELPLRRAAQGPPSPEEER